MTLHGVKIVTEFVGQENGICDASPTDEGRVLRSISFGKRGFRRLASSLGKIRYITLHSATSQYSSTLSSVAFLQDEADEGMIDHGE